MVQPYGVSLGCSSELLLAGDGNARMLRGGERSGKRHCDIDQAISRNRRRARRNTRERTGTNGAAGASVAEGTWYGPCGGGRDAYGKRLGKRLRIVEQHDVN